VLVLLALMVSQALRVDPMDREDSRVEMEASVHFGLATCQVCQEAPNCEET